MAPARGLDNPNGQFGKRSFVQVPVCFESMHPPTHQSDANTDMLDLFPGREAGNNPHCFRSDGLSAVGQASSWPGSNVIGWTTQARRAVRRRAMLTIVSVLNFRGRARTRSDTLAFRPATAWFRSAEPVPLGTNHEESGGDIHP